MILDQILAGEDVRAILASSRVLHGGRGWYLFSDGKAVGGPFTSEEEAEKGRVDMDSILPRDMIAVQLDALGKVVR